MPVARCMVTSCAALAGHELFVTTSPPLYSLTCPAVNSTTGRLSTSMPAVLSSARSAQTVMVTVFRLQCRAAVLKACCYDRASLVLPRPATKTFLQPKCGCCKAGSCWRPALTPHSLLWPEPLPSHRNQIIVIIIIDLAQATAHGRQQGMMPNLCSLSTPRFFSGPYLSRGISCLVPAGQSC